MGEYKQAIEDDFMSSAMELLRKSAVVMSDAEMSGFALEDMSLGALQTEGFGFVDILRSEKLRVTVLVLLPWQTLPEHLHPAHGEVDGKEETLRVLYGETRIYVPGPQNNPEMVIPAGKETYYTSHHEIRLRKGEQYTIPSPDPHWFQAGPDGSVNMTFQNRVDETKNVFTDPKSSGCPIPGPAQQQAPA